jgi:AbrB family looped-hinge helix DNA binding protein
MEITRLSTKGQIVLPKGIRASRAWGPGTEFTVEETGNGSGSGLSESRAKCGE